MLHPDQFQVNEAWIAFKLNDEPIRTEQDGDFDFLALMDAASCFILGFATIPADRDEPTQLDSKRLLRQGHGHNQQWPRTLFVPAGQPARLLAAEAERLGIVVVSVAEAQLLTFISEARESFQERFGG